MVCGDCIQKLAIRLARNHKLDFIQALMLAQKGIARYEQRVEPKPQVTSGKGNPSDYTQSCTQSTCAADVSGCTKVGLPCVTHTDCDNGSCACTGSCGCPAPLPNSHQVSGCNVSCIPYGLCGYCFIIWGVCIPTCYCGYCPTGHCEYNCDVGFHWNGSACVPDVVPLAGLQPQKVVPLLTDT